jgi:hypothetical protein
MSNRLTKISAAIRMTIRYSRKSDFLFWMISRKYFRLSWMRSNCARRPHALGVCERRAACARHAHADALLCHDCLDAAPLRTKPCILDEPSTNLA